MQSLRWDCASVRPLYRAQRIYQHLNTSIKKGNSENAKISSGDFVWINFLYPPHIWISYSILKEEKFEEKSDRNKDLFQKKILKNTITPILKKSVQNRGNFVE